MYITSHILVQMISIVSIISTTLSDQFRDWFIRRRLYLKYLQYVAESAIACLPAKSRLRMYVQTKLDTCVFWFKTLNFRVLQNWKKNADYKVFELEDFLSPEECDAIVAVAKEKGIRESTIVDNRGMHVLDLYTRKSKQVWLKSEDHPLVQTVSEDVSRITCLPATHQEQLQVVAYHETGYYKHHFDASFHPDVIQQMNKGCGPRLYTLLVYLNDDFEGGETDFEEAGIRIQPKKGKAILFQNIDDRLDLIPESFHAGLPVRKGTKWIANKWVRIWPMDLQDYMRRDAFKDKPAEKKLSLFHKARFLLHYYTIGQWQWWHYVLGNPKTLWGSKMDMLRWTYWNTCMVYNACFMPPPTYFPEQQRVAVMEIGTVLSEEACQRLIIAGHASHVACDIMDAYDTRNIRDVRDVRDIDDMLTNNLLQCILLPVENERAHVTPLMITHQSPGKEGTGGNVSSPYGFPYPPLALRNTSRFGLCMVSLYVFLNEEPEFEGGAFDFSYVQSFVRPQRGKAILCLHLNESMAFDCLSFCYKHPVTKGHQWIAEKHIHVLPVAFQSALQNPDAWRDHVMTTLRTRQVNIKIMGRTM